VFDFKCDLFAGMMPASVGRIKASAGALPLARLSALTRPADAGFGWPSIAG